MNEIDRLLTKLKDIKNGNAQDKTLYSHLQPSTIDAHFLDNSEVKTPQSLVHNHPISNQVKDDSPKIDSFLATVINPYGG